MLESIRTLLLAFAFLCFGFSVYKLTQYWEYDQQLPQVGQMLADQVSAEKISSEITTAIEQDRLEDAKVYLEIAKRYGYPLSFEKYEKQIAERDTGLRKVKKGLINFSDGFISGKGEDLSGIAGAVTADFTVIGDARDLHEQYQIYQGGGNVNELIVGLAGVGIGLTAATIGSAGTLATAKAGTSLLKVAARTGRLTSRFSRELLRHANQVFNWRVFKQSLKTGNSLTNMRRALRGAYNPRALKPLERMADNVNNIRKNTSIADTLSMMRYVENTDDLRRLKRFTTSHAQLSKGLLKLLGKGALRSVRVLRKTLQLVFSVFTTLVSGLVSLMLLFGGGKRKKLPVA